jgi:superfamily I DNA/RNA helicase
VHPSVAERLARLAPDQRAAATAPSGPVLCVAPAGSGKTTTLVARVAWLIDAGVPPVSITAITFNKRAAEELRERLVAALAPLAVDAPGVRVRTFHALGREILKDAGVPVEPLADRDAILRAIRPSATGAERARLDTAISRLKLDLGVTADEVAADPEAGPVARAFVDYERAVAATGGLDFDDLVIRAIARLEGDVALLSRWRLRCAELLVDEVQDLDRSQLRLALLLAAPDHRLFLVGDDDQSIYGWRLADVRRLLGLAESALPGLARVDLVTNYRCPAAVVERAVRLVEHNTERFAKRILARAGAAGTLLLGPSPFDDTERVLGILDAWASRATEGTKAVLARTNGELLPAMTAALARDLPFDAPDGVRLLVESPLVDDVLRWTAARPESALLVRLARVRESLPETPPDASSDDDDLSPHEVATAILGWAVPYPDLAALSAAIAGVRERLARLRRDDAELDLATAHGTKGLEFDHVAVIGMDEGRFPSARSLSDADDPARALEEERRLAYVAWTRARRSLTLVYDPGAPSPFLSEAFFDDELGAAV